MILEANFDPFQVTSRFPKALIDTIFESAQKVLISEENSQMELENQSDWAKIAFELAKYFHHIEKSYNKTSKDSSCKIG